MAYSRGDAGFRELRVGHCNMLASMEKSKWNKTPRASSRGGGNRARGQRIQIIIPKCARTAYEFDYDDHTNGVEPPINRLLEGKF